MAKNKTTINFIIGSISLLIGGLIYIIFRQDILALQYIKDSAFLKCIKIEIHTKSTLINWIIYSLPDALWYFSLLIFNRLTYTKSTISNFLTWVAIILPFVLEGCQLLLIIPGTFCLIDLTSYFLILIIYLTMKQKKFLMPIAQICIIGAFGILAMGCASMYDFSKGYTEGYELFNFEEPTSTDDLNKILPPVYNDSADFALFEIQN